MAQMDEDMELKDIDKVICFLPRCCLQLDVASSSLDSRPDTGRNSVTAQTPVTIVTGFLV